MLVALERGRGVPDDALPNDADIALAAITASELLVGVELADGPRRATRQATVDAILDAFDALPFDPETARHHASLLAHARRSGRVVERTTCRSRATAPATNRILVTTDRRAFDDLPEVGYRVTPPTGH